MFIILIQFLTLVHFFALGCLSLYGVHRLWLLYLWHRKRNEPPFSLNKSLIPDNHPRVTVQLPVYNERFVAARLIDSAAQLDWPADKLDIQILDDSDDDTNRIIDERIDYWGKRGITIKLLRRSQREGYKAGALACGLAACSGDYLAVFDADFVPPSDFLKKTVPYFMDAEVGMVQARWGFLNADHSWLTRIQAILLGAHFSIEHWVRYKYGMFFNFNGTAGIWRRETIESAGGWQADTVTEDLDLSYRAQLAGWKFVYLDDLVVPSELPVTISAFRSQQQRWAKGSIQTAKKILPAIMKSPLQQKIKMESCFHLLANFGWLMGMIITLTLFPAIVSRTHIGPWQMLRADVPLFIGTSLSILFFFLIYTFHYSGRRLLADVFLLPVFSIAMAPGIAMSVIKGVFSRGGVFWRTPKFGIQGRQRLLLPALIYKDRNHSGLLANIALLLYSLLPLCYSLGRETWFALPMIILFPCGFLLLILKEASEITETVSAAKKGRLPSDSLPL
jgi:cellulose synthase/poly-beta-1,6-N-acetylglucosamine synthase-like glycosyltransferase